MFFRRDQPGLAQNGHVMGDGRLRELDMVLNVTSAHAYALANGALAFLFQQPENLEPRRISHGLEGGDELFIGKSHVFYIFDETSMQVNVKAHHGGTETLRYWQNCQDCQNRRS